MGQQLPNTSSGLAVQTGQTLALVGSQIDMTGAKITAPDGQVKLWAVRNAQITMDNQTGWQLANIGTTPNWGAISLQQSSVINVDGIDGGAIDIRGQSLTVKNSSVTANTVSGQGKGIAVQTTEFIDMSGVNLLTGKGLQAVFYSGLATFVSGNGGRAGNITIKTRHLEVSDGIGVRSISTGKGSRTGDITIQATDVTLNPLSSASFGITGIATLLNAGNGETGNLTIEAERVRVSNGGRIGTDLRAGTGKGGNLSIHATESLNISGRNPIGVSSAVGSTVQLDATGQGGNIFIDTGHLVLSNGGNITSSLGGSGIAGDIDIRATDVSISDPIIDLNTQTLSGISVSVGANIVGQGGTINLRAENLRVFNGGQITSSSQGLGGNAGNINLQVKNIDLQGISQTTVNGSKLASAIAASSTTRSSAGSINIKSDAVHIRDGAQITVSNTGKGDAGNLNIAANNIFLDNGASLQAQVNGGSQGNIQLQANDYLLLRHGSNIITNAGGASTGGNIKINAGSIVAVAQENSDIAANALLGQGGNIKITTQGIFGLKFQDQLTPESDITASSQFGLSGTVQVNTIGIDPNSGLVELPANVTDSSQQIANGCSTSQGSRFVATGRGGVPQNPLQQVGSDVYDGLRLRTWSDIRDISAYRKTGEVTAQIPPTPEVLVQATSWHRNAQGKIELVADKSPTQVQQRLTCAAVTKI